METNQAGDGKLRLLLIAEQCNPQWTSVPLLAYCVAKALASREDLDVTLVSQVRNREALESDPSPPGCTWC